MPLVRCANNGLSCWIDPFGGLHEVYFENSADIYRAGFKIAAVPLPVTDTKPRGTFYNQHGDVFGWFCVSIVAGALVLRLSIQRKFRAR